MSEVKLAIKNNNCATNDACALCGGWTDPSIGPELFLDGTWAVVCWNCGEKNDEALVALLKLARAAARYGYANRLLDAPMPDGGGDWVTC